MSGKYQPLGRLAPDNIGPAVNVVSYTLVFVSIVIAVIRFWHALKRKIRLGLDDITYLIANVFAIACSALWHLATTAGLGKHMSTLGTDEIDRFFKAMYAAQFPGIAAMFFAKTSMILLLDLISPQTLRARFILLSAMGAWAFFSFFAVAFQCHVPQTWIITPSNCPAHGTTLYLVITFNALTDVILALWIVPRIWSLKLPLHERVLVIILFGMRICVCIPAIIEMALLGSFLNSTDLTWASTPRAILELITVYLSVICVTIPRTNPFFAKMQGRGIDLRLPRYGTTDVEQVSSAEERTQSLEVPSTKSGERNNCRAKEAGCDGERPCSRCRELTIASEYTSTNTEESSKMAHKSHVEQDRADLKQHTDSSRRLASRSDYLTEPG